MSKYYDRLVKINESLDCDVPIKNESVISNTNFERALANASSDVSKADALVMAFWNNAQNDPRFMNKSMDDVSLAEFAGWLVEEPSFDDGGVVLEGGNEDTIEIPKDSLTDEQKKDILKDNGVDKNTVDAMKTPEELNSAMDATLNNDKLSKESSDERFVIRMDDDDLEMHGYLDMNDTAEDEVQLTDEIEQAKSYVSMEDAKKEIHYLCDKFHYDPSTFKVEPSDADDQVNVDDGESWVSLDPMKPDATTMSPM